MEAAYEVEPPAWAQNTVGSNIVQIHSSIPLSLTTQFGHWPGKVPTSFIKLFLYRLLFTPAKICHFYKNCLGHLTNISHINVI